MRREEVRNLFEMYRGTEIANYEVAEFFMYLIGTGVTRTLYELTAQDRKTHTHLFDIQVEGSAEALESRAHKAGTNSDEQAVAAAFKVARRIIDTNAYKHHQNWHLEIRGASESLNELLRDD